jgi:triosephosphate isomerase (TIM)
MNKTRRPLIAGNWKLNNGGQDGLDLVSAIATEAKNISDVDIVVAPPATLISRVAQAIEKVAPGKVGVAGQNLHWEASGAFTGEHNAAMLLFAGAQWVIIGHSERRQFFGETDETVARRSIAALEAGLGLIACVGESEEEREAGDTEVILRLQVESIRDAVGGHERLVVAYEPVWAIGTGKTATPEQAQEAHAFIKSLLDVPVLYGGSVKPENANELLSQADVDGALVGGASLEVESFTAICQSAARIRS